MLINVFLTSIAPQLPHSYYFTSRIIVLKFANKGVFFEEIQDLHFHRKRGYFSTHLREFGEKRVNFDVQCFTVKKKVHLGWKVKCFTAKMGVHFGLKSQVFYCLKGVVLRRKVCFTAKKGDIFKLENKDGYHYFQWVRELGMSPNYFIDIYPSLADGHIHTYQTMTC